MLIVLTVKHIPPADIRNKVKAYFKPYHIRSELLNSDQARVLHLTYESFRGDLRLGKLKKYTDDIGSTILCDKELSLKNTPYRRFESYEYNIIMMRRLLLSVLGKAGDVSQKLRIAFFDPKAEYPEIAEELLRCTSRLTVVSNMPRFYENESDRLLQEYGAPLIVSNSLSKLEGANILVCPAKIKIPLPTDSRTLVFTSQRPIIPVKGTVLTEYPPEIPQEYRQLCPEECDRLYFLSALYSLCHIEALAALNPVCCGDHISSLTEEQLIRRIRNLTAPAMDSGSRHYTLDS